MIYINKIINFCNLFLTILANYETFGRENEVTVKFPPGGVGSLQDEIEMRFMSNTKNGAILKARGEVRHLIL